MEKLKGAMTALITPFKDGKVDEEKYAKLIQRQIDHAIDVVVPVGTTGESATLTHDEHKKCIEIAVEVCKGTSTKVMAGAGSNSTHEAIDLAQFAQKAGADAILSVSPYYNKPTQEGLYQHYKALANAVDIPVLLYNVPGRTGVDIKPETVFRLFDEVENIYGIKEATGSIERCVELLAKRPELYVISGDDTINYPIIANGGMGVISVTANLLPDKMSMLVHAGLAGQFDTAKMINDELFDINKALFIESNPIPIKAAMYHAGLLDTLEYRLPLVPPSKENMAKIENALTKYKVVQ
ncbi:4-hydroxy-tetrahydrodipicolinate synthase [Nitratiruptor tergarcus]|uniref:4-hydroxy-tetrahydrodipicolinate synthase n=1 Tax=Nitratiruptor tergarcus DSM 16512 TaxID=1069081 RepID=A0A1W1WUA1_9BACT|nr:4-hydroxy-tetrahydrodipicolinate synthase [Nitratiruptor tergarcus]SMC09891.1 4-hydroxy-tetrahydrodipicolinate synthase [Nitratiruptor tergarcus DSM 16512]